MLETVKFLVGDCPSCGQHRLMFGDLDDHDELVLACVHCKQRMPPGFQAREYGVATLHKLGYRVEGEVEHRGCGSGEDDGASGCGSGCGSGGSCGTN